MIVAKPDRYAGQPDVGGSAVDHQRRAQRHLQARLQQQGADRCRSGDVGEGVGTSREAPPVCMARRAGSSRAWAARPDRCCRRRWRRAALARSVSRSGGTPCGCDPDSERTGPTGTLGSGSNDGPVTAGGGPGRCSLSTVRASAPGSNSTMTTAMISRRQPRAAATRRLPTARRRRGRRDCPRRGGPLGRDWAVDCADGDGSAVIVIRSGRYRTPRLGSRTVRRRCLQAFEIKHGAFRRRRRDGFPSARAPGRRRPGSTSPACSWCTQPRA